MQLHKTQAEDKKRTILVKKRGRPPGDEAPSPRPTSSYRELSRPAERVDTFIGYKQVQKTIEDYVWVPLNYFSKFSESNLEPAKCLLITGASGSGKTCLVNSIAGTGFPYVSFFRVFLPEVLNSENFEGTLNKIWQEALENQPALLHLRGLDVLAGRSDKPVSQNVHILCAALDRLRGHQVVVLGTALNPECLDASLRRSGRFSFELELEPPNEAQRVALYAAFGRDFQGLQPGSSEYQEFCVKTSGFLPADLKALAAHSYLRAMDDLDFIDRQASWEAPRVPDYPRVYPSLSQVLASCSEIQPAVAREGLNQVPDTRFEDIGALDKVREELELAICQAIKQPRLFAQLGLDVPAGILLYGPPGCGKTLLAKAVANASQASFIAVNGPEVLNKFVGESEREIRNIFKKARDCAPCILFFDEFDALCPVRGESGGNMASERVVSQLLTELDGVNKRVQVFVMAATNRPDMIDPALRRPGRLGKQIYVKLPNTKGRIQILQRIIRKTPNDLSDAQIQELGQASQGFSGADLAGFCREAGLLYLRSLDTLANPPAFPRIPSRCFFEALEHTRKSVTSEYLDKYETN